MENKIIKTKLVKWEKLSLFQPADLKKMSKSQLNKLKKSIKNNGFKAPFYVWENDGKIWCLDGHQRIATMKILKSEGEIIPDKLTANFIDCKDRKEAKELVFVYGSHYGNYDNNSVVDFVGDLDIVKIINETTIKMPDIKEFKELQLGKRMLDSDEELKGAFQLKSKVKFESGNYWGIPELDESKLVKELDFDRLETYCGQETEESKIYLYLYNSDIIKRDLNIERSILGFYVDDYRFENLWMNPAKYTTKLMNLGFTQSFGVNYSLYRGESYAFQLLNTYRSRWCTRYLQMAGIDIIPDINFSDEGSYEFCFMGLPKNGEIYSVQMQNHKDEESINYFKKGIKKVVEILNPKNIIVYLGKGRESLIKDMTFEGTKIYYLYNRSSIKKTGGQNVSR